MIEKIDGYKNNPENSSTTKVSEHTPSGFSMSTISSFRRIENKRNIYKEVTTVCGIYIEVTTGFVLRKYT